MGIERSEFDKSLVMHQRGVDRARGGRRIIVDAVRGIKERERRFEYVAGYIGAVSESLERIGITNPEQIGVNESFMHVATYDSHVSMTAGIEGLADGMSGVEMIDYNHWLIGQSHKRHYEDGYKIGVAFLDANLREGKLDALVPEDNLDTNLSPMIKNGIKVWLSEKGIEDFDSAIVVHLQPYARMAFAQYINHGEEGLGEFLANLSNRVSKDRRYEWSKKQEILQGIEKTLSFARNVKSRTKTKYPVVEEAVS